MFKKITAFVLAISLSLSAVPALGDILNNEIQKYPFYYSFTGTVKEITERENGNIMVYVEGKDEAPAYFVLNEKTYFVDGIKIEKEMEIIGFYETNKPMILIYPPQYNIDIVATVTENISIKADKYDSDLLSKDKMLKLNVSDDTEIIWENNTTINWIKKPTIEELSTVLSNRKLIVFYDFTTRSIPAQTTPKKIIVLSEQIDDSIINIIVNDKKIDAPLPYINEEGITMVPIRAISEALGYKVSWNNDNRSVQIDESISFKINDSSIDIVGKNSIKLETNSIINNERTYVPLSFYNLVLNALTADIVDNNVVIITE